MARVRTRFLAPATLNVEPLYLLIAWAALAGSDSPVNFGVESLLLGARLARAGYFAALGIGAAHVGIMPVDRATKALRRTARAVVFPALDAHVSHLSS